MSAVDIRRDTGERDPHRSAVDREIDWAVGRYADLLDRLKWDLPCDPEDDDGNA